jgi:hypothetical protein
VNYPAHRAGLQKINYMHFISPPLAKGGEGGFREIIYKIPLNPLIPLFQRGKILKN